MAPQKKRRRKRSSVAPLAMLVSLHGFYGNRVVQVTEVHGETDQSNLPKIFGQEALGKMKLLQYCCGETGIRFLVFPGWNGLASSWDIMIVSPCWVQGYYHQKHPADRQSKKRPDISLLFTETRQTSGGSVLFIPVRFESQFSNLDLYTDNKEDEQRLHKKD